MVTKLYPPRVSGNMITRPRLLELFNQNKDAKLLLFTAPAGYGKTVATFQYINDTQFPFVWYQLDQYDNDPATFIQYLITGISRNFPGFGGATLQLLQRESLQSSLRLQVIAIVNELAALTARNLRLVLDDYHAITNPTVDQFLKELIEHLPQGIQMIITSRTAPSLALSRLQMTGAMVSINSEVLRFSVTELQDLLRNQQLNIKQELIEAFHLKTGGWPAAVRLLIRADFKSNQEIAELKSDLIYNYLVEEILNPLPEEVRSFLLATAVLDTITPKLADLLLERQDSQQILDYIEAQQLFMVPLTGQDKSYRYHQLFRDHLLERLGAEKNLWLCKAGKIALENGAVEQAIELFFKAAATTEITQAIENRGREAFRFGRWQTVERWLAILTPDQIATNDWLALFQAKIAVCRGKLGEGERWIGISLDGFTKRQDEVGIAECQFLQAKIFNRNGRYQAGLDLLVKAYPVLQKAEPALRFDLPLEQALIFIRMGRLQQAEAILLKGLQVGAKDQDAWITAHFLEGLGNTYYMLGETHQALEYYQKAARLAPSGILPGYCPDFTGFLYQELGEMDQAFVYLQESIAQKEEMGLNEALLPAYFQLSGLYADINELEKAEAIYEKACRLIAAIGGERFFLILLKVNLGRIRGQQGKLAEAQVIFEEILHESQAESGVALIMSRLFYSATFLMSGNFAAAEKVLVEVLKSRIEFAQALTQSYFLMASVKFLRGDLINTAKYSRKLLEFAAQKHFEQMFVYMFDNLKPALEFGLEYNVEVAFIQRVLILLGEGSIGLLAELASHRNANLRARIVFPLAQINTDSGTQLLQKLANDPEPKVRKLVAECTTGDGLAKKEPLSALLLIMKPEVKGTKPSKEGNAPPIVNSQTGTARFLEIGMLGPLRIIYNQTDITQIRWRFTKSRDLLLYLAHQGKPVGIYQILEDLWPDQPLEKAANFFYNALSRLRQVIQSQSSGELVTYTAKTCELIPTGYRADRQLFLAGATECAAIHNINLNNVSHFEETIALYRGEYLSQLDYPWVISERELLNRLHLETAIRLAKFYLQVQEYLKIVKLVEPLAEQNPIREELFSLLMPAYHGLGDYLAVIRKYQKLKSNLNNELGIEPAPEITKLYYQLCNSEGEKPRLLKKV